MLIKIQWRKNMLKVRIIIISYLILVIIFNLPSKKLDKLNERMEEVINMK